MEDKERYGVLLQPSIKLHRQYFREALKLIGIRVLYRAPYPGKHYTTYAEIESNYNPPILVGCLFDEHPTQQTLKKLGWVSELQENASLIHVDYDLPDLQQGALFIVPSGIDNTKGRLFRVVRLTNSIVYPSSMMCEIVPEYEDVVNSETEFDYSTKSLGFLNEETDRRFK